MNIKHVPDLTHRHDADFIKLINGVKKRPKSMLNRLKTATAGLISSMKLRINNGVLSVKYA